VARFSQENEDRMQTKLSGSVALKSSINLFWVPGRKVANLAMKNRGV
jgi:hypothetical protein